MPLNSHPNLRVRYPVTVMPWICRLLSVLLFLAQPAIPASPESSNPILFTYYTLSRRVLTLTVQLAPLPSNPEITFEYASPLGPWKKAGASKPDPLSHSATFHVADWDDTRNTAFRITCAGNYAGGTIRRDPKSKLDILAASIAPGPLPPEVLSDLRHLNPDLLLFPAASTSDPRQFNALGLSAAPLLRDIPALFLPCAAGAPVEPTELLYGGVSFAILPTAAPSDSFLETWAADWSGAAWTKAVFTLIPPAGREALPWPLFRKALAFPILGAAPAPYGLITFHRARRTISTAGSFPAATIRLTDNGLPHTGWQLGLFSSPAGFRDPVVQVIDESRHEIVYTFRIQGELFDPPVPGPGRYTVRFFDPDKRIEKVWANAEARR